MSCSSSVTSSCVPARIPVIVFVPCEMTYLCQTPSAPGGAVALEMGVREYQFVRRYLERTPQLSLRQIDPLIRELVHYRDLINQKTQEPTS